MSWARDSIGPPLRQPHCRLVTAQVHAKLISLATKTRYVTAHVRCPAPARNIARPRVVEGPAAGGMAGDIGIGSRGRALAGDRLCHPACRALDLDPDQSEGSPGCP